MNSLFEEKKRIEVTVALMPIIQASEASFAEAEPRLRRAMSWMEDIQKRIANGEDVPDMDKAVAQYEVDIARAKIDALREVNKAIKKCL